MRARASAPLEGYGLRLEPLGREHLDELATITDDEIWRYQPQEPGELPQGPTAHRAWVERWYAASERAFESGAEIAFAVRRLEGGALLGSTRYLNIAWAHLRVEIGGTFYSAEARGSSVNPACKRLLMTRAFEELGCHRVELKCDARNQRSRRAIAALGAVEEGTFRRHMILGDGHVRDTVYFSVIDREWPAVRAALDARLAS